MHKYRTVACRGCGQRIGLEDSYPIDDCPYADHEGFCQQQEAECSADICPEVEQ